MPWHLLAIWSSYILKKFQDFYGFQKIFIFCGLRFCWAIDICVKFNKIKYDWELNSDLWCPLAAEIGIYSFCFKLLIRDWVCWTCKSDLSSTTKCDQKSYFGQLWILVTPKVGAKHECFVQQTGLRDWACWTCMSDLSSTTKCDQVCNSLFGPNNSCSWARAFFHQTSLRSQKFEVDQFEQVWLNLTQIYSFFIAD